MPIFRRTALLALCSVALAASCTPPAPPPNTFDEADHEPYFPIGVGAVHQMGKAVQGSPRTTSITCEGCHGGGEEFAQFYCLNCHGTVDGQIESAHSLVDKFERDVEACYACHKDGKRGVHIEPPPEPGVDAGPVSSHDVDAFPYSAGTPHGPDDDASNPDDYMDRAVAQGETHCSACHASSSDLAQTRCAECHEADEPATETLHTGRLRAAFDDEPDCKKCHWTTPLPSELDLDTHDAASCTDHFGAQCFGCHDPEARQGEPKVWAIDFSVGAEPVECAPCHAGEPRDYPSPCN